MINQQNNYFSVIFYRSTLTIREYKMKERKGVTIYFNDSTKLVIEYPALPQNGYDIVTKMKETLDNKHFIVEADGAMLYIPVDNIKYLQIYPAPEKLPTYAITGASIIES